MSVEELAAYANSPTHRVFYARVTDRFGDYGIIAFALVAVGAGRWHIESLLMSCRVLSRGIEDGFLAAIAARARQAGAAELTIGFVLSEKNQPAADFVKRVFANATLAPERVEMPAHIAGA